MPALNEYLKPGLSLNTKIHDVSVLARLQSVPFTGDMKKTFLRARSV